MWAKFTVILALVSVALCAPQQLSFDNGRLSVGAGGYQASVGLGGGPGGGGLFAQAGTPYGQQAGAGLGGSLNGQPAGGGFAGANAGNGYGASASLGGNANGYGGLGAEAHTNSQSTSVIKLAQPNSQPAAAADDGIDTRYDSDEANAVPLTPQSNVQKVSPANNGQQQVIYQKRVTYGPVEQYPIPADSQTQTVTKTKQITGPVNQFDYTKFFDFGYFSGLGTNVSGGQPQNTQGTSQVIYQKSFFPFGYQVAVNQPAYVTKSVQPVQYVKTVRKTYRRPQYLYVKKFFPFFQIRKRFYY